MQQRSNPKVTEGNVVIIDIDRCGLTLYPQKNPKFTAQMLSEPLVDEVKKLNPDLLVFMTHRTAAYIQAHQYELLRKFDAFDKKNKIPTRNYDNTFTSQFVKNFAEAIGYKDRIIVSMRGDKDQHCGYDFEKHAKPYEEKVLNTKRTPNTYILPTFQFSEKLHPGFGKNTQLQQIILELPRLCPELKSLNVFCYDDMLHICLLTAHFPVPSHITLKSYYHCSNDLNEARRKQVTQVPRLFDVPEFKIEHFKTLAKTLVTSICNQHSIHPIPETIIQDLHHFLEENLFYLPNKLLCGLFEIDDSKYWYLFGKKHLLFKAKTEQVMEFLKYLDEVTLVHLADVPKVSTDESLSDAVLHAFGFNLP